MPPVSLSLALEAADLDVTGKKVANCAVPCYFFACGIAGQGDPTGTYRPCFQVRVDAGSGGPVDVELSDSTGKVLAKETVRASTTYVQLPLYSKPNEPFAPGRYQVKAKRGEEQSASAAVRLR